MPGRRHNGRTNVMIEYMLTKLQNHILHAVQQQKEGGNIQPALGGYELVFEALYFYEQLGHLEQCEDIQLRVLEAQPSPAMVLHCHAMILYFRRHYGSALEAINAALLTAPDTQFHYQLKIRIQTALNDISGACATYNIVNQRFPDANGAADALFMLMAEKEMPGPDYYDWLLHFHQHLKPATYVEIGLGHGRSLALAGPETKAIGIDPYQGFWERLNYVSPHNPATLFPMTSDDFFAQHDLREEIGQDTFDLGFIDGLHLFEQALKDFINLERYARKDSVILIHDCLPVAPIVAERERCTGFWTGDVWRIIPCLKTFRPDLKIFTIPTKPSGLGVVTNLDPASCVLSDNFQTIVDYYLGLGLPEPTHERFRLLQVSDKAYDHISALLAQ